jgi:two-component system response regulator DegU
MSKDKMIDIMIADDHKMFREGIKNILEYNSNIKVVAEAANGDECLKLVKIITPSILLLDISLPLVNGIDVLKSIKNAKLNTKVIIVTVHTEINYLIKAIHADTDGYVLKDSSTDVLIKAIETVSDGQKYIEPDLIPKLNNKLVNQTDDEHKIKTLTKREMNVLILTSRGMINKEIGSELNISERTVKNHLSNIFRKIGVSDRTQAAIFAIKNNIVEP